MLLKLRQGYRRVELSRNSVDEGRPEEFGAILHRLKGEEMSRETLENDMNEHPELTPILDTDRRGAVICLGWKSPIYDWNKISDVADLLESGESK